jgi:hypothetical protein
MKAFLVMPSSEALRLALALPVVFEESGRKRDVGGERLGLHIENGCRF